jgi:hypothetical protein
MPLVGKNLENYQPLGASEMFSPIIWCDQLRRPLDNDLRERRSARGDRWQLIRASASALLFRLRSRGSPTLCRLWSSGPVGPGYNRLRSDRRPAEDGCEVGSCFRGRRTRRAYCRRRVWGAMLSALSEGGPKSNCDEMNCIVAEINQVVPPVSSH